MKCSTVVWKALCRCSKHDARVNMTGGLLLSAFLSLGVNVLWGRVLRNLFVPRSHCMCLCISLATEV